MAALAILLVFFSSIYLYNKHKRYHFLLFPITYLVIAIAFYFFTMNNMKGWKGSPRAMSYIIFGNMPLIFFTFYGIGIFFQDLWKKIKKQ